MGILPLFNTDVFLEQVGLYMFVPIHVFLTCLYGVDLFCLMTPLEHIHRPAQIQNLHNGKIGYAKTIRITYFDLHNHF